LAIREESLSGSEALEETRQGRVGKRKVREQKESKEELSIKRREGGENRYVRKGRERTALPKKGEWKK